MHGIGHGNGVSQQRALDCPDSQHASEGFDLRLLVGTQAVFDGVDGGGLQQLEDLRRLIFGLLFGDPRRCPAAYRPAVTEPESTDGFVGSAFGAGWPLGWCVCAGRRVLGRAGLGYGAGGVGLRRALWAAQMIWGRAVVKVFAQGQLSGRRSLCRPLWLTRRPGTVRSRLGMVAATVSCSVGWTLPRRAVQRARLCARTLQASRAALAKNRPEGQRRRPLSLRSLMASSTVACCGGGALTSSLRFFVSRGRPTTARGR